MRVRLVVDFLIQTWENLVDFFNRIWSNSQLLLLPRKERRCPYCFHAVTPKMVESVEVNGIMRDVPKCENCSKQLPSDFFYIRHKSIAVVGGTDSGKSTYITVFCALLLKHNTVLNSFGFSANIINREGRELFEDNYATLYLQKEPLEATRVMSIPIIIRLQKKNSSKVLFITLIDSPGEEFSDITRLSKRHPNLVHADGILFLISPLVLRGIFNWLREVDPEAYRDYIGLQESSQIDDTAVDILSNLYELFLRIGTIKPTQKIQIPTVFCISRADIIGDLFDLIPSSDLELQEDINQINRDLVEVSQEIEDFLMSGIDPNLNDFADRFFANKRFCAVSPIGSDPINASRIIDDIDPHGVLYPIIWILQQIKILK